jgi:hypothetical protein
MTTATARETLERIRDLAEMKPLIDAASGLNI